MRREFLTSNLARGSFPVNREQTRMAEKNGKRLQKRWHEVLDARGGATSRVLFRRYW